MDRDVSRLERYRDQLGFTQADLGQRVGVTRQTIAAWEKGERDVSVAQLARLAKAMGVPLELLLDEPSRPDATLLFRADDPSVLSPELRAFLSEKAEDYAAVERLAGEVPVVPESRPLDGYDPELVERVARETRDWLGAEEAPLDDVLALFETKGLKILLHPLPAEVSGFSAYTEAWGGVIVVNERHAPERQSFTALHEFAHLIFHRREYDGAVAPVPRRGDPREKVAQRFAGAVLLPREVMERELRTVATRWVPEPVLVDLRLRYGVSMRTVLLRAADLGLIPRGNAGRQVGILNRRFGPHDERPALPRPTRTPQGRLAWLTYRALLRDAITTSRAAEVLSLPLAEVREQLAAYLTDPLVEVVGA